MDFLANTWWIWLIVAVSINIVTVVSISISLMSSRLKSMGIIFVFHIVSVIPWIMASIGAVAALIGYIKS